METENKDWKPEVGKTAWYFCGMTNKRVFCATVLSLDENEQVGKTAIVDGPVDGNRLLNVRYLYPSMEAALASIKIYDLEGKEVVIPRARSIFEGDDLHRFLRDEAGQSEDVIRGWDIPHVKQIPMRTIEEQNVMLSPDGESYLIDKQEYFDWCLRNEDTLCMFLDSKIRGGAAIGGKSDQREGGY